MEMADPTTRTTWGNYLAVPVNFDGIKTMVGFNDLVDGDLVELTIGDKKVTLPVIQQFGQGGRIQTVITEEEIASWYERALRGKHAERLGDIVLERLAAEIIAEFPVTEADEFEQWWNERGYQVPDEEFWQQ